MSSLVEKFNSKVPWPLRYLIVIGVGLGFALKIPTLMTIGVKLQGNAPSCSWMQVITLQNERLQMNDHIEAAGQELQSKDYDETWGIELFSHPLRDFWIRREGGGWQGGKLLGYLIGDHRHMRSRYPERTVREGDIVIDCGAHVGVFAANALELGAEKVVAIDPDPTQVECLRRNFPAEIASGKLILVPKGVWSEKGSMTLSIGTQHSGVSSLVKETGGNKVEVEVTTIDAIVAELALPRVDYIKFDIEGAEREALKGAEKTLTKYQPRLFVDSYHQADDAFVLPEIIRRANSAYRLHSGFCEATNEFGNWMIVPHYVFYE